MKFQDLFKKNSKKTYTPPIVPNQGETPRVVESIVPLQLPMLDESPQMEISKKGEIGIIPECSHVAFIGLGSFGRAVLEEFCYWYPQPQNHSRSVKLLSIEMEGASTSRGLLPPLRVESQKLENNSEILRLPRPQPGNYDWFQPDSTGQDQSRLFGRAAILRDLGTTPSRVWDTLSDLWKDGQSRDIVIVGTAFDDTGSGLIFDLAHMIRLVAQRNKNFSPKIYWVCALPSQSWAENFQAQAGATVRELTRLKNAKLLRRYPAYNSGSDKQDLNRELVWQDAENGEEINSVIFCLPPEDISGENAGSFLINKIASMLVSLTNQNCFFKLPKQPYFTFGSTSQYLPLPELQQLIRWQFVQKMIDSLFINRNKDPQVFEENDIVVFFNNCNDQSLRNLTSVNLVEISQNSLDNFVQHLCAKLREFKGDLDKTKQFLEALDNYMEQLSVDEEVIQPIKKVVEELLFKRNEWVKAKRKLQDRLVEKLEQSTSIWQQAIHKKGLESVVEENFTSNFLPLISEKIPGLEILVKWGWTYENNQIALEIYAPSNKRIRLDPRLKENEIDRLLDALYSLVVLVSADSDLWPSKLSGENLIQQPSEQYINSAAVLLDLPAGSTGLLQSHFLFSSIAGWQNENWWPTGINPVREHVSWKGPLFGILLQFQGPIAIGQTKIWKELSVAYQREKWAAVHVLSAEYQARKIEQNAIRQIPDLNSYQLDERRRYQGLRLNDKVVAALQWDDRASLFRDAYLAGLVEPTRFQSQNFTVRVRVPNTDIFKPGINLAGSNLVSALYEFCSGQEKILDQEFQNNLLMSLVETIQNESISGSRIDSKWWEGKDSDELSWNLFLLGFTKDGE